MFILPYLIRLLFIRRHDRFRTFCVSLAQRMYRAEVKLRTGLLGEPAKHIRPLSEQKCVLIFASDLLRV